MLSKTEKQKPQDFIRSRLNLSLDLLPVHPRLLESLEALPLGTILEYACSMISENSETYIGVKT